MEYFNAALNNIYALSIHWSSDCNIACSYCYIKKDKECMASLNQKIRKSLEDGSYANNIKQKFAGTNGVQQLDTISLWGAEPTINGPYFKEFLEEMQNFFPNLKHWMFSTNAKVGGEKIFKYFLEPLLEYADNNNHPLSLNLQFSLDGPAWINDESRYDGATQRTRETMLYILNALPEDSSLTVRFNLKPTLDVSYMKIMCDRGIDAFNEYYKFFQDLHDELTEAAKGKNCAILGGAGVPTLVDPGDHSKEDGQILAQWVRHLKDVDRTQLPAYENDYLLYQPLRGIIKIAEEQGNFKHIAPSQFSCSAGRTEVTIDYLGNLYVCERISKNLAYNDYRSILETTGSHYDNDLGQKFMKKMWSHYGYHLNWQARRLLADPVIMLAAKAGEIDSIYLHNTEARTLLYYSTVGLYCHVGVEEDITSNVYVFPFSYARLLGNGAIEALIEYRKYEEKRHEQKSSS